MMGLFSPAATKRSAAHKTDNMKTVVLDRIDGQPRFHPRMLDFASYYGFLPRVCHPYRPQTKGKIESTIRYIKSSFWPGLGFGTLAELNRQALVWCGEVNRRVHGTTREVPLERLAREGLTPLNGQPDYDTKRLHADVFDAGVGHQSLDACLPHDEQGSDDKGEDAETDHCGMRKSAGGSAADDSQESRDAEHILRSTQPQPTDPQSARTLPQMHRHNSAASENRA